MIESKKLSIIVWVGVCIALIASLLLIFSVDSEKVKEAKKEKYVEEIFGDEIISIDIIADPEDWESMIANATAKETIMADVVINGEKLYNVGVRPKGNASLKQVSSSSSPERYSLHITFDEYMQGQTCFGLDELILNNMLSDATYMKEYLSQDVMRYIGVEAPLTNYANISVNGETFGFYVALEYYGDSYLTRVFGNAYGNLYSVKTMEMGGGGGIGGAGFGGGNRPNRNVNLNTDQNADLETNQVADQNADQNVDQAANSNPDQNTNQPADQNTNQLANQNANQPADQNANQPADQNADQSADLNINQPTDQNAGQNDDQNMSQNASPNPDQSAVQNAAQNANQNAIPNANQAIQANETNLDAQGTATETDGQSDQIVGGGGLPDEESEELPGVGAFPGGGDGGLPDEEGGELPGAGGFPGGGGRGFSGGSSGGTLEYTDDNLSSYSAIFNNAHGSVTTADQKKVVKALKNLSTGTDLEKYFDVDSILRYFAAHTVVVSLDSYYSNMAQNYFVLERNGQVSILPWDYHLSYGSFQSGSTSDMVNFPIDTPVSGVTMESRPMLNMLLSNEEYLAKYHEYLQEIVDGYFNSGLFEKIVRDLQSKISSYVENDPSAYYAFEQFETGVDTLIQLNLLRAESIAGQLDGSIPSTTEGQKADSSALIDASTINMSDLGSNMGGGGRGGMRGGAPVANAGEIGDDGALVANAGEIGDGGALVANAEEVGDGGALEANAGEVGGGGAPVANAGEIGDGGALVANAGEVGDGGALEANAGEVGDGDAPVANAGEIGDGQNGQQFDFSFDTEVMQQAMEIISGAGGELSDEATAQLTELGLTDDQITVLSNISNGMRGGNAQPAGGAPNFPDANNSGNRDYILVIVISLLALVAATVFAAKLRKSY